MHRSAIWGHMFPLRLAVAKATTGYCGQSPLALPPPAPTVDAAAGSADGPHSCLSLAGEEGVASTDSGGCEQPLLMACHCQHRQQWLRAVPAHQSPAWCPPSRGRHQTFMKHIHTCIILYTWGSPMNSRVSLTKLFYKKLMQLILNITWGFWAQR